MIALLKRLFGYDTAAHLMTDITAERAATRVPLPLRKKVRVVYDITADAIEANDWTLRGNDAAVLRSIALNGPVTACEIERHTGLGKKAVESSVYRLRRKQLVVSKGMRRDT